MKKMIAMLMSLSCFLSIATGCGQVEEDLGLEGELGSLVDIENDPLTTEPVTKRVAEWSEIEITTTESIESTEGTENPSDPEQDSPEKEETYNKQASYAMSNLAVALLKQEITNSDGNILISPDSIATAMIMAQSGAKGNTLSEIDKAITRGISIDDYIAFLNGIHKQGNANSGLKSDPVVSKYTSANSMWISDIFADAVQEDFINKNKNDLNAEVFFKSFDKDVVKDINQWVNKNTDSYIPEIIDQVDVEAVMYLINAVVFSSPWADPYNDSQVDKDGKFTDIDGKEQKVNMLNGDASAYMVLNGANGMVKQYANGFAFVGIVPPEGTDIDKYISSLNGNDIVDAFNNLKEADVVTYLPEFTYEYDTSLVNTLKAMGIKEAFTEDADFSNMFKEEAGHFHIDDVIHKTFIELNQNGTKAAAATAIVMKTDAMEMPQGETVTISLDRPFVYMITDNSGTPVFIGAVKTIN